MTEPQRVEAATQIMKGMDDKIKEAGAILSGGQTVMNPWVMTGGSVLGMIEGYYVKNKFSDENCSIILTKPIGAQLVINFKQYFRKNKEFREKILSKKINSEERFEEIFEKGFTAMGQLNLYASQLMRKYGDQIKACTDVTGFGIKGHAENLAQIQKNEVDFVIDTLPVYGNLHLFDKLVRDFKLEEGLASETSGGLMIVLENQVVDQFMRELKEKFRIDSWKIGRVVKGSRKARLSEDKKFQEIW